MYLFTIRSKINPKSELAERFSDIGGAYVNCYISFKDFAAAEHLSKWLIRQEGWIPEKRTDARRVTKKHFKTKKEKQYYSDVMKYGWSLVSQCGPPTRRTAMLTTTLNLNQRSNFSGRDPTNRWTGAE
jgi:hypothetical protein